jgi:hypothetical protein
MSKRFRLALSTVTVEVFGVSNEAQARQPGCWAAFAA